MKSIKSVVLFYNSKRKKSITFASSVERMLKARGAAVVKICVNEPVRAFRKADAAVTVGGDGTVLYAARHVIKFGMPVLGINAGGMGFLSGMERSDFRPNLAAFLGGRLNKVRRQLLSVEVRRRSRRAFGPYPALNDCVIRSAESRAFKLRACFGRKFLSEYFGDGLIISTPTGSTAYNLAASGPIVLPGLGVFLLSPICPHTLTHRPIVLPSGEEIRITVAGDPRQDHLITMAIDGQENFELEPADEIVMRRYPRDLEMLVPDNFSYFDVLRKKLSWGER